jgi:VanZ family protein
MRDTGRAAALWLLPLALMVAIFALSSVPNDDPDRGLAHLILRKAAHFTEYALLAGLWWRALRTRLDSRAALVAAFSIAAAYAVTDEIHQTFVDTRVGSPVDVLIDVAGAAAATALIARRRRKMPT